MNSLPRFASWSAVIMGLALGAGSVSTADDSSSSAPPIRETVLRSLTYLGREGQRWIDEKKCVTCHRVSFLTWSVGLAGKKGLAIDRDQLKKWNDWSLEKSIELGNDGGAPDGSKNIDGLAQMILAAADYGDASERRQVAAPLLPLILNGQREDGSWAAGGQLPGQKRPKPETDQVTTMWVALALGTLKEDPAAGASRERAVQWLANAEPGKSTEWQAARLLLADQSGESEPRADALARLRSFQNPDGGWGWIAGEKSDALATGLALYALSVADVPPVDEDVTRATRFLLSTQQMDGSWSVPGTKMAKKDRIEETSTYWGTAWAVIGLLETIDDVAGP